MPKILIDTSLYIDFLRTGRFEDSIKALYTFRTRDIFFSSVVVQELLQGAVDEQGKKYVEILYRPFEKTGRIVTPTHKDWKEAGGVLAGVSKKFKSMRSKIPRLLNDTLLAMSARRIGAVVYCTNIADFELIFRLKPFEFQSVQF